MDSKHLPLTSSALAPRSSQKPHAGLVPFEVPQAPKQRVGLP